MREHEFTIESNGSIHWLIHINDLLVILYHFFYYSFGLFTFVIAKARAKMLINKQSMLLWNSKTEMKEKKICNKKKVSVSHWSYLINCSVSNEFFRCDRLWGLFIASTTTTKNTLHSFCLFIIFFIVSFSPSELFQSSLSRFLFFFFCYFVAAFVSISLNICMNFFFGQILEFKNLHSQSAAHVFSFKSLM